MSTTMFCFFFFFFQAEDGIRDLTVTGVQTLLFRSGFVVRRHPRIAYWCPPAPRHGSRHEASLDLQDRASGHGQTRTGRARDGARALRKRRWLLGERGGRDRRDPAARRAEAATAGRAPHRGSDRARHGDARRRADPARGAEPAAADEWWDSGRGRA